MSSDDLVKKTIILPKTNFSIRRSKSKDEEIILSWEKNEIYEKSLLNKPNGTFTLHDGPPYANGSVHIGHFVNRTLKDFSLRFYNSIGFSTEFNLAWDTYGLPIEFKVLKENKKDNKKVLDLRESCRKYAFQSIETQRKQLKKFALLTNYDKYFSTQDFDYQSNELKMLAEILKKDLIYRGKKPVYWSWSNQTALAENEVEYFEKEDHSLFFKVNVKNLFNYQNVKLIVWTTQPWTILFNRFIAVDSDQNYSLVNKSKEFIIVSEDFTRNKEYFSSNNFIVKKTFKGKEILGVRYEHPYSQSSDDWFITNGKNYVSTSSGTGIVHIAPSCGPEDFDFAKKEEIEVNEPLDEKGRIKNDFFIKDLKGIFYQDANNWIIKDLGKKFQVFDSKKIIHSYPHDWRDKTPVVYRATEQWFMKLLPLKDQIKNNIEKVSWVPEHLKEKMISFIENRDEWCISRQRMWGLPIPSIVIDGKQTLFPEIVSYVAKKVEKEGSDFWFREEFKKELKNNFSFLLGSGFEIGKDTLDVWFDSGILALSGKVKNWKADLYLEGKDQFRGWFNSSLILSTALKNEAPCKKIVSHGFVVDENGKKMSKSSNNGIDVSKIIDEVGVDVLRLWVLSFDFSKEMKFGENIILKVKSSYQKIRNTLRFIIGNLQSSYQLIKKIDFQKNSSYSFSEINVYILSKLWSLALQSKENFFNYKFSGVYNLLSSFCTNDLSSFYFEITKDTLYCDDLNENFRKEVLLVIYSTLQVLLKIISPITPLLAEEVYKEFNIEENDFFCKESVHLIEFPNFTPFSDANMKKRELEFEKHVISLRKSVFQEIEKMRKEKLLENSSQSKVFLYINNQDQYQYLQMLNEFELKKILMVAEISLIKSEKFFIEIEKSSNKKCERCWRMEIKFDKQSFYCDRCLKIEKSKEQKI